MKNRVNAQYISRGAVYLKSANPHLDDTSISQQLLDNFDRVWTNLESRLTVVPGKELLSSINEYLQTEYSITLSHNVIITCMTIEEIPNDIVSLLGRLESFRSKAPEIS